MVSPPGCRDTHPPSHPPGDSRAERGDNYQTPPVARRQALPHELRCLQTTWQHPSIGLKPKALRKHLQRDSDGHAAPQKSERPGLVAAAPEEAWMRPGLPWLKLGAWWVSHGVFPGAPHLLCPRTLPRLHGGDRRAPTLKGLVQKRIFPNQQSFRNNRTGSCAA